MTLSPSSTDLTEVTSRLPAANVVFASGPTGFVIPPFPVPPPAPGAPALRPAFPRVLSPAGADLAPVVEPAPVAVPPLLPGEQASDAEVDPAAGSVALTRAGRFTNDDFLGCDDEPTSETPPPNVFLADNADLADTADLADSVPEASTTSADGFLGADRPGTAAARADRLAVGESVDSGAGDRHVGSVGESVDSGAGDRHVGSVGESVERGADDRHVRPVGKSVERGADDRHVRPGGERVLADNAVAAPAAVAEETPAASTPTAPPAEPVPSPREDTPDAPPLNSPVSPAPIGPDLTSGEPPTGESLGQEIAAELSAQAPTPQPAPQRPDIGEWRGIVLVTGTDTDVGKTIVTAAVAAAAQSSGLSVAVIKPGQTGTITGAPTDIDVVTRLAAPDTTRVLAEYPEPMAPLAAATVAELPPLELYEVVDAIRSEAEKHDLVLVEGAGGLLVPMGVRPSGEAWTVADLAITLNAQTIVVARAGLGTLNHTALTLEALNRRGVPAGVVIGAWPANPELVHWANLSELVPHLVGALPDGAGSMDPGVFRRSAPGWLTPPLYGVIDNWRVWAEETDGH